MSALADADLLVGMYRTAAGHERVPSTPNAWQGFDYGPTDAPVARTVDENGVLAVRSFTDESFRSAGRVEFAGEFATSTMVASMLLVALG